MDQPLYKTENGSPRMRESVVLLLDILGYQEMIRGAKSTGEQQKILSALHGALSRHRTRLAPNLKGRQPWYSIRAFTDNIVIGRPILDDGEAEIGHMALNASDYQLALAQEGFFVRGAITVGRYFMDEYAVFGPALIEAYDIETKRAVYPRIVLSETARTYVQRHVQYYGGADKSPHNAEFLVDADGEWFVNYLHAAGLDLDPDIPPPYQDSVRKHRNQVRDRILAFQRDRRVLEKYLWTGRYHNFVTSYLYPGRRDLCIPGKVLKQSLKRLEAELPSERRDPGPDFGD